MRALGSFVDAEATPLARMIDQVSWTVIKRTLELAAEELGRRRLKDLWSD